MTERFEIVEKAILKMLEDKKYVALRDILETMNPVDVAEVFSELEERQIPLLVRLVPKELAAESFAEMDPENQEYLQALEWIESGGATYRQHAGGYRGYETGGDCMSPCMWCLIWNCCCTPGC